VAQHPPAAGPGLSFETATGYLLARAGAEARRRWARMLVEHDLTPHQYGILMALRELGPTGPRRLSELIGVDARNLVSIVDALVDRAWVIRELDAADRRRRVIALTAPGRTVVRDLTSGAAAIEAEFLKPLTAQQQRQLHHLLHTLLAPGG
jgi:DNA-binding MarR family transcriptional regulator